MRDKIKKWWNREWSNWEKEPESFNWGNFKTYIVLKRTSNDGLIEFKLIHKL